MIFCLVAEPAKDESPKEETPKVTDKDSKTDKPSQPAEAVQEERKSDPPEQDKSKTSEETKPE